MPPVNAHLKQKCDQVLALPFSQATYVPIRSRLEIDRQSFDCDTKTMQPKILDGKIAATEILENLCRDHSFKNASVRRPGLAVVQVGENPASSSYIRGKKQAAERNGMEFFHVRLARTATVQEVKHVLSELANDLRVDGYILQLPLDVPNDSPLNTPECVHELLACIPPDKDADGLHSENQGRLFANESSASSWKSPLPATALGVVRLLNHYGYSLMGKEVCVLGKSRLVGMPTAGLCLNEGATVSVCHSKTSDIGLYTRRADIIVVATGRKHLLRPEHIDPQKKSVVIDVGIHADPQTHKLSGDLSPESYPLLGAYTPVPGGVGPMTVAMLIENTLRLHSKAFSESSKG